MFYKIHHGPIIRKGDIGFGEIFSFLLCFVFLNRPNRLTQGLPNSNPLGIKRFVSEISISFTCECQIIMQIQHTKNLKPRRLELGTTLS